MDRSLKIMHQGIKAVGAFKLRTFFCVISVALGIAAITIIVAATEGAYKKAYDLVELFGPDALLVVGGANEVRGINQHTKTLTLEDVEAVREAFSSAYSVAPITDMVGVTVSYKNNKGISLVVGSTGDYSREWSWPVVEGTDICDEDVRGARNVALIGWKVTADLFPDEYPVGKYISIQGIPVKVVGVLAERGITPTGQNMDDRIVLPITTVMRKMQNESRYVSVFRARFDDRKKLGSYEKDLRLMLRSRHKIAEGEPDDFTIFSPKEIVKFLVSLTGSLVAFLGTVGIISLVVSGFVLANLFLLSVKERTKEIGIRRSVGAKKSDIRFQFLSEAIAITTLGGVLGFALALASSELLRLVQADLPIYFSWKPFAAGLVLSWIVGIVSGLQPASRAANLKPIEAIRE